MAALIQEKLGLQVELVRSSGGEFTVWVDDLQVAGKTHDGFPSDEDCLAGVSRAVAA